MTSCAEEPVAATAALPPARPAAASLRRGTLAVLAAVAVQSVGNLVFHALAGRGLAPGQYGALGALLAVMTLLAVPLAGLQTAVSGAVASRKGLLTPGSLRHLVGVPTLVSLAPAAALVLGSGRVGHWLQLDAAAAALLAPTLVVAVALACVRGVLLGAGAPLPVAAGFVASVGVRVLAVVVSPTLSGALLGTLAGEGVAVGLAVLAARTRTVPGAPVVLGSLRVALGVASLLALFLFTTGDLLLARHHLEPSASGAYVAAATVAKTALALPAAAMSVLFPRLVAAWSGAAAPGAPAVLRRVGGVVVGLAAAGALVLLVAPDLVLGLLFHDVYAGTAPVLRVLAVTALLSSVVTVAVNSAIARGSIAAVVVPAVGALLQLLVVTWRHDDALAIARASATAALATVALALATEATALARARRTKPAQTLRRP